MRLRAVFTTCLVLLVAGQFAWAQDEPDPKAPSPQEVLVTLVREAPNLTAKNDFRGEDPSDLAVFFLAEILYEIAVISKQTDDTHSLSITCDASTDRAGNWDCWLALGIKWSGAESAIIGQFELQPDPQAATCRPYRFDQGGDFTPCGWRIYEQRIDVFLIG